MSFTERDPHPTREWTNELKAIKRFSAMEMVHRTDVHIHTQRVHDLALVFASIAEEEGYRVDLNKIARMSLHHDDAEIETSDIPSPVKRAMTPDQKAALKAQEQAALVKNVSRHTTLPQDVYLADLEEAHEKQTTESQIVDIADKVDGLCETLHEIRAGAGEPYFEVLENYRVIFGELARYPFFAELEIGVPTEEEARAMPIVDIELIKSGDEESFWEAVHDSSLPEFYQGWMSITQGNVLFRTIASSIALFPGWAKEFREARGYTESEQEVERILLGEIGLDRN